MANEELLVNLQEKIGCALFIAASGAIHTGIATKQKLMHPYTQFKDIDADNAAAKLLTSLHSQLLRLLPPTQIQTILTDLDEYLLFVVGDQQQSNKNRHQEE